LFLDNALAAFFESWRPAAITLDWARWTTADDRKTMKYVMLRERTLVVDF
jgi:hypothetical protein